MSDEQHKDDERKQRKKEKKEKKKREKEQREEEKREQERIEEENRELEKREQDEKEQQAKVESQNQQNEEEQPTTSANKKHKHKKNRRVYYSAISASEEEDLKFVDAKSSSENFRDAISRTDNEAERSAAQTAVKSKSTAIEPMPIIPETVKDLDDQPDTSKAKPTKKKTKKAEPAMALEKDAESTDENEEKVAEKPIEKPQQLPVTVDGQKEETQEKPTNQKIADDTERRPSKDNESAKEQENVQERKKSKRDSRDGPIAIVPLPIALPDAQSASSEPYPSDNKPGLTQKIKTELEKFEELTDEFNDDDTEDYEMYLEKMKAKKKKMSKSAGNHKPSEAWAHDDAGNLDHGGAFVYMVIPPDGGFGWLILLVSFLCQVIVDGIVLSLGIVLPFIAEDMDSSPSTTSLVASTQIGIYFFTGPISSAFINKFGFRPVALFGCIMSISAILISTLSVNLTTLIIFYSIFGGMSLSMIWSTSQLIIGYYFEKYRPIASGVSCSGAGAGVLIFSYMNSQLAPKIGWRNTSRVHVLFLVFVLLIVLCYVEVEPKRIGRMMEQDLPETETDSDETGLHSFFYSRLTLHDPTTTARHSKSLHGHLLVHYEPTLKEPSRLNKCFQCFCPPFRRFMEKRRRASLETGETKRVVIRQDPLERQDIYYTGVTEYEDYRNKDINELLNEKEKDVEIEILPIDTQNAQSIHYNLAHRHESLSKHSLYSHDARLSGKTVRGSNAFLEFISPAHWVHPKIKRAFNMLFDLKLLGIMEFQVLLASAFFFPMGFNIPFVYSKVRAELDPVYTNLISPAIGFSNFFFRITSGVIAFKFRHHTRAICGYGIVFGGAITLLSSFYGKDTVWFQFIFAICFGIAPAFYSTLRAIIYVQMLGLDKLTNAFGLTAMAMGAGVFIGTFTGGLLIELTGSYVATFAFAGICMILAGSLKLLLPTFIVWRDKIKARKRRRNRKAARK